MNVCQKYGIDPATVNAIGEFCILWNHFEQLVFEKDASVDKIRDFSQIVPQEPVLRNYVNCVRREIRKLLAEANQESVRNRFFTRKANERQDQQVDIIIGFLNEADGDELFGCLLCVYRIRNNMFHGNKDVYKLDMQKNMFEKVNELLMYILSDRTILRNIVEWQWIYDV